MQQNRLLSLKHGTGGAGSVVYIMSRDQRVSDNHALIYSQQESLRLGRAIEVLFCVYPRTGYRNKSQYRFMLDGLREVEQALAVIGIKFTLLVGKPNTTIAEYLKSIDPASVYFDFSPLKGPRNLQKNLSNALSCSSYVVDTHNAIPIWVTSRDREFAAHTIRRKIHNNIAEWLIEPEVLVTTDTGLIDPDSNHAAWDSVNKFLEKMPGISQTITFKSGEASAKIVLGQFVENRLEDFAVMRNLPNVSATSDLSPYLHFGQISSLRIALESINKLDGQTPLLFEQPKLASPGDHPSVADGVNALLEELIVRKELADNYCFYTESYTTLDGAWPWAVNSLAKHSTDIRTYVYGLDELIAADTHDEAWNAAQKQMMTTGKMHGYMRMYWAKKILEWSESPESALQNCIFLNDTYSLDGGDPNGYTGIMWSIAGVHDRPWIDRPIFGQIRYMNLDGLKRKFNIDEYIKQWTN